MYNFSDYYELNNKDPLNYEIRFDKFAMSTYAPGHCMSQFDFNRPKKMAP